MGVSIPWLRILTNVPPTLVPPAPFGQPCCGSSSTLASQLQGSAIAISPLDLQPQAYSSFSVLLTDYLPSVQSWERETVRTAKWKAMLSTGSLRLWEWGWAAQISTPPMVKSFFQPNRGDRKSICKYFRGSHLVGSRGLELCMDNTGIGLKKASIVFYQKAVSVDGASWKVSPLLRPSHFPIAAATVPLFCLNASFWTL